MHVVARWCMTLPPRTGVTPCHCLYPAHKVILSSENLIDFVGFGGIVLSARLRDKFGDFGLIATATLRAAGGCARAPLGILDFLAARAEESAGEGAIGAGEGEGASPRSCWQQVSRRASSRRGACIRVCEWQVA